MLEFQVEITNSCYLNCIHCSSDANSGHSAKFSPANLIRFFGSVTQDATVYLTGGEPLSFLDFPKLVYGLASERLIVGIYSSGISHANPVSGLSSNYAKLLKSSGLSECYFSLYDSDSGNHDRITGVHGSHSATIASIASCLADGINSKVHLVVNRNTISRLDSIIKSIAALGVSEIRLLRLVNSGRASSHWDIIGVDADLQTKALTYVFNHQSRFPCKLTISGIPEIVSCRSLNPSLGCVAGSKLFYVTINGDVFPCACVRNRRSSVIGNVNTDSFSDIMTLPSGRSSCLNAAQ